jgi:hypothetical protein
VRKIRDAWGGKFILKGILDVEDAQRAADFGADAIIVSNHGGRQLDGALSSIRMLPSIARAVGDLFLKLRHRLLQLGRHQVELVGELLDLVTRIGGNGSNNTRHRRIHFHRYLISFKFHQGLISRHGVTGFFQPTRDGGGRNAFAQSGHDNIGHCSIRSKTNTRQPARAARTNASC